MSLTTQEVKKIAHLARIKMSDEEITKYQIQLNKIFSWIEQLGEVNTDSVEPLTAISAASGSTPLRKDEVTVQNQRDAVLANCPQNAPSKYGYFPVPKVIE